MMRTRYIRDRRSGRAAVVLDELAASLRVQWIPVGSKPVLVPIHAAEPIDDVDFEPETRAIYGVRRDGSRFLVGHYEGGRFVR